MKTGIKALKISGYILGGLLGFVVVLIIAVNFLLQTGFFTGFVLDKVLPGVSKSINGEIEVKNARISLFPPTVLIEGVSLNKAGVNYKRKFLELDRLFIDVSMSALLSGRAVVEKFHIEGVTIYAVMDKDGVANLPMPPPSDKPEEPKPDTGPLDLKMPVVVEDFQISKTAVYVDMPEDEIEAGIRDMRIWVSASLENGRVESKFEFKDGFANVKDISQQLTSLEIKANANLQEWTATLKEMALRMPGISVDVDAEAKDLLGAMAAKANINVVVDASTAQQFVPDPKLSGEIVFKATADVTLPKTGPEYQVNGNLALNNIMVNDLPVNLAGDIYADPKTAEVKGLKGSVGTGTLNFWSKVGLTDDQPMDAQISMANLNIADAAAKFGVKIPVTGNLTMDLTTSGSLAKKTGKKDKDDKPITAPALGAKGTVTLSDFAMGQGKDRVVGISKIAVVLDAGYSGTVATLNKVLVSTGKNTIDVKGTFNTAGSMDIALDVNLPDLSEYSPVTGKALAGSGKFTAVAKGTPENPQVKGQLKFNKIVFDQFLVEEVAGTLGMSGKNATIESLTVRTGGSRLKVKADVFLGKPMKATATVKIPKGRLEDFMILAGQKDLKIAGNIDVDISVDGPVDNLSGKVAINLDEISAFEEKVKSIVINARLDSGVVNLDPFRIVKLAPPRIVSKDGEKALTYDMIPKDQWVQVVIEAKGKFDPASGEVDLKLRTQNLNELASDTLRKKGIPLKADLAIAADVSGTIKDPLVKAKIEMIRARYGDFILGDSVINADVKDQLAKVNANLLSNRWVERTLASQDGWSISNSDTPQPEIAEHDPNISNDLEDFTEKVETKQIVEEKGEFGALTLNLSAGLSEDQKINGELKFDKFDYTGFLVSLRDSDPEDETGKKKVPVLEGLLNGVVNINGTLKEASKILVELNLDELLFHKNDLYIRNQDKQGRPAPILVTLAGSDIDIKQFLLGGKGIDLVIQKTEPSGGFEVLGKVDLGIIKEFTPVIAESKGTLDINASVPKDFKIPGMKANVSIKNGLFDVLNSPTAVEDFNFDLNFADGRATIDKMNAKIGGGTLKGEGQVVLDISGAEKAEPPQIDLVVKLRDIKTGFDPYLEAVVKKVDIIVTDRAKGGIEVAGEVVIDKAVYSQDIDFLSILKSFQKPKQSSGSATFKEQEENLFFNIAIRADDNIVFRNNVADIEAKMDLLLTGSNTAPAILGSVELVKGTADVLQNTYTISRGVISFFDEDRIYPNFDINVETPVDETTVFITISGNPDHYKMLFRSDPPKSERDIVTLLALGVSYEDFQAGGSGLGGDEAAALAAQQLVGSQIKNLTGDSGFDISVDSDKGEPRVKVRNEIEKDLYFTVYRGIAEPNLAAEIEYDFIRNLALIGDWDNLAGYDDATSVGAFGAGLKLKIDFK